MAYESPELTGASSLSATISRRYQANQFLMVDYALGVAIIGLNPFQNLLTLTLCIAAAIILKMMWDIRRNWGCSDGNHLLAIASFLFNLLGALTMGFMALLTLIFAGVFFPIINRFALSAALMTVTWIAGAVTNQFFLNGYLNLEGHRGRRKTDG